MPILITALRGHIRHPRAALGRAGPAWSPDVRFDCIAPPTWLCDGLRRITRRTGTVDPRDGKGVREAERRLTLVGGDACLDLAGLELNDSDLRTFRPTIGNLTALTELWLDKNQLTVVPEAIGNLTALTDLRLDNNQLTEVPETIGNLTALTALWLSDNQLTAVPDAIGNLTALTALWLDNNKLTVVPVERHRG